jgi:diguanylate cyclase (GGDEF)-like protein/PAS domain S-box-containing protein
VREPREGGFKNETLVFGFFLYSICDIYYENRNSWILPVVFFFRVYYLGGIMSEQKKDAISRFDSIRTRLTLAFVFITLLPMVVIGAVLAISGVAERGQTEASRVLFVVLMVNASVALAATLIATVASLIVTRGIATPLSNLAETATRIAAGNLELTATVERKDEIGALAQTFNFMTDKLKQAMEGLRKSEEKYRGIFESALEGIFQSSLQGRYLSVNPALARMLGYDSPEDVLKNLTDFNTQLYANDVDRTAFLSALFEHGKVLGREVQFYRKDRQKIWVSISATLVRDAAGNPLHIEGLNIDITARKQAEESLRKAHDELEAKVQERTAELSVANEQLRQTHLEASILYKVSSVIAREIHMDRLLEEVLNTISRLELFTIDKGGIFIVEGDRMRIIANVGHSDEFLELHKNMKVGDCLCGAVARTGEMMVSMNSTHDERHTIVVPDAAPHGHLIVPLKTKDRVEGVMDLYIPVDAAIDEAKIKLMQSIGNQLGIAIENARLYQETKALSLQDSLTGLWNHEEILRILDRELARADRDGTTVGILMADLDHFKKVNDTYGHMAGDVVLHVTAKRMLSLIRTYDAVGRYGGEEFIVVLPGCDQAHIQAIAERFRSCIGNDNVDTPEGMIPVTISLGVAVSAKGKRLDSGFLVRAADAALYRAKEHGRNRVETASDDITNT